MKKLERDGKLLSVRIKNMILVVIGTLIAAFGTAVFVLPHELVFGGLSGMALVLDKVVPFEFFTVDLAVTILTWSLFFMGLTILGKSFALKTLISSIVYPIGITLFGYLAKPEFLDGFFLMTSTGFTELPILLSAIFGGVLIGSGCAITFLAGGSTGGVDIIAFTICKIFKRAKSATVLFMVDSTIIVLGMFVIKNFVLTLLGIVCAFASATMIDRVLLGGKGAFVAEIVTDNYEEINHAIISDMERTSTIIDAVGGYSGRARKMLTVSFTIREYAELVNIINKYDKTAFVTIHRAHEINGEGWTR